MIDFHNAFCQVFFNNESLEYFNEINFPTEPRNINTRSSVKATFQKIEQRFE